jgi:hypothetical protein
MISHSTAHISSFHIIPLIKTQVHTFTITHTFQYQENMSGTTASAAPARDLTSDMISMIPGAKTIKLDFDKILKDIPQDDKTLVGNVIKTMHILRSNEDFISNVEICPNRKGYDVIGTLANSLDKELIISNTDFEVIQSVNPTRISTVMVQVSNKAVELVVRVYSHATPITYNSVQISHIAKKTRWF